MIIIAQDTNSEQTVNTAANSSPKGNNNKKKKQINIKKAKKIIKFITTHFTLCIIIVLIIVGIIVIGGLYSFFTTMPGMVLGKVGEFGRSIWAGFSGFFTGDSTSALISKEDVKNLAQYLQNMGYDIEGYGFGKVTYEDNGPMDSSKTISSIEESMHGKKVLRSYLAANEETYCLTTHSVWGAIKSDFSLKPTDDKETSTGLINIVNGSSLLPIIFEDSRYVKIDRENEKMIVYTKAFFTFARWGSVFSYDLSNWTARYGRPTELFLAIHLSTMMPDLSYKIATDEAFNTKVNMKLQPVTVNYTVKATGNDQTTELSNDRIIREFLNNCVSYQITVTTKKAVINESTAPSAQGKKWGENPTEIVSEPENVTPTISNDVMEKIFEQIMKNNHSNKNWSFTLNIPEDSEEGTIQYLFKDYVGTKTSEKTENNIKTTTTEQRTAKVKVSITSDDNNINSISLSKKQLSELADLSYSGKKGISNVGWPRITDVTKHWFYKDIEFENSNTTVYGKAKKAHKTIDFTPEDEDSSLSASNYNGTIKLDAILSSNSGVQYQVIEPEVDGPNDNIVNAFSDKYYRYDGTAETAKKIENGEAEKESVNFENKSNALTAFSILENMHTEAADSIYRNLKELVVKLNYFTKDEVTEPLNSVLLWLLNDNNYKIDKDINEYGIVIKNTKGNEIIAPGDATITQVDGDTVTLQFHTLSSETVALLQRQFEQNYYKIDPDIVLGMKMKIKGISSSVTVGDEISRGNIIGTSIGTNINNQTSNDLMVVMYNLDNSIVDNVETYMNEDYTKENEDNIMHQGTNGNVQGGVTNAVEKNGVTIDGDFDYKTTSIGATEQEIKDFLSKNNFTDAGIYTVMGYMRAESGFKTGSTNGTDGGYGLLQWTGGRKTRLISWCNSNGLDYKTVQGQEQFFLYELENSYSGVYRTLTSSNNLEACVKDFFCNDEAGSGIDLDAKFNVEYGSTGYSYGYLYKQRLAYAQAYKEYYGG